MRELRFLKSRDHHATVKRKRESAWIRKGETHRSYSVAVDYCIRTSSSSFACYLLGKKSRRP